MDAQARLRLNCPSCAADRFGLRVLADQGLAAARCDGCGRDFLVLDSEDHWYEAIQSQSPRPRRCSCKSASFRLACDYVFREDGDVRSVELSSDCAACGRARRQMHVDVDYGDTADLVKRPLRFCPSPNLRYDLRKTSLYLARADMAAIVAYQSHIHGCSFVCWRREHDAWVARALGLPDVQEAILAGRYFRIFASLVPLDAAGLACTTARQVNAFWQRHEVLCIDSPICMNFGTVRGELYAIDYANEFVENGAVVRKSAAFRAASDAFLRWLGSNFVSWRGPLCFDNPSEHLRLFGDRFRVGKGAPGAARATVPE